MITWWHQTFNKLFAVDRGLAVIGCGSVWPELSSENFVKKYINYNVLLGTNDYGNYKQDYMVLGRQHIVFSDLEVTSSGPFNIVSSAVGHVFNFYITLPSEVTMPRQLEREAEERESYIRVPPPALPAPPQKKLTITVELHIC